MERILPVFLLLLWCSACNQKEGAIFRSIPASKSNLSFVNTLKDTPELNILTYLYYYNGAGVAAGDFNNDGLVDLYFAANQDPDKLYLNEGDFKFKDVTNSAGIDNSNGWTTGVTHIDINNDGLLDLYVCKVSDVANLKGRNLLYINLGIDGNGIPTFEEKALEYGLDFSGYSTQAAFFDYDLDGDMDMYLLNHSTHPNRTYGKGSLRESYHPKSGDILFENSNGKYVDVSYEAGIYQGATGYGLGLSISDINNDGYPDIYVGNDFFENDYLYQNNQDGTFTELISSNDNPLGHTTHFSMGNTISDLNNDGFTDIVSLDMLPENLLTYKTSGLEYAYPIYSQYLKNGYQPQFMQNTLHLNIGGNDFLETAELSGIAATEWSWGPLVADFNNDGYKDIYITNGILGATNDMDYMNFIANEDIQRRIDNGLTQNDMPLTKEIPEKKVENYFFLNNNGIDFTNMTKQWSPTTNSFSNGAIAADLDNDGDLDIVVNNINEPAYLLENTTQKINYLKIKLNGDETNTNGIGARVEVHSKNGIQIAENYPSRGYLSSQPNTLHFGLGKDSIIDSIKIHWSPNNIETIFNSAANQTLNFTLENNDDSRKYIPKNKTLNWVVNDTILNFLHKENSSLDFNREPLIPFASSNQGPDIAVADVNLDGLEDFFVCGAKNQSSGLYLQNSDGGFSTVQNSLFEVDKINEDTTGLFFDANGDDYPDLIIGSGGNEFTTGKPLQPRLLINQNGQFLLKDNAFKDVFSNTSEIATIDLEQDGDQDLIILSDRVPGEFGATPQQFIFKNDGLGNFEDVTTTVGQEFNQLGNITDAVVFDYDQNGFDDILIIGHWMAPTLFLNNEGILKLYPIEGFKNSSGLWNTIELADLDNDGDLDVIAGNWGLNSKLKASAEMPLQVYRSDFDDNGRIEPLVTYFHDGIETPFSSKDDLTKQLPFLNKKFLTYQSFAEASLVDLFGKEKLNLADKKKVNELASCWFENLGNGQFTKHQLPLISQISAVHDILVDDFNDDGYKDLLIGGNNFEINTQLGRLDALRGLILHGSKNKGFTSDKVTHLGIKKAIRNMEKINIGNQKSYLIAVNNGPLTLIQKTKGE